MADPAAALKLIREDLGDCTRCKLHKGRTKIVFGVGNPRAELMFVGEGPGADEDAQGEPFVGRAGQLLNNMIKAMGLRREDVYIANVVKCRPPGNRHAGAGRMRNLLAVSHAADRDHQAQSRGRARSDRGEKSAGHEFVSGRLARPLLRLQTRGCRDDPSWHGARLAVTYHPAYLLRDPRQKGEAWKDLQMVMKYLGNRASEKSRRIELSP